MKKFILLIVVFVAACFLAYKLLSDKPVHQDGPKDKALSISKNSPAFNNAFDSLLGQYFAIRDALVEADTLKADQAAYRLAMKADSLPTQLLKADTSIILTARSLAAAMSGDARGFAGEGGLEGRRQSLNVLTDELYNLVRTVHYDEARIYHIRCPMAFKDSVEGFWLSYGTEIVNPYLGRKDPKMLGCGEVIDSFPGK
jgi:Protein of unknown function (DUF3347)